MLSTTVSTFVKEDINSYLNSFGFKMEKSLLDIFCKIEENCSKENKSFFIYDLIEPIISNSSEIREIINKYGGDVDQGIEFMKSQFHDKSLTRDEYDIESYREEQSLNERNILIKNSIRIAESNSRKVIMDVDVLLALLEIHDLDAPIIENGTWNDKKLHTNFNTLSHIFGKYCEYIWVKNEDIKWELTKLEKRNYDIAISFAGEDRSVAEEIARKLTLLGVKVFYDNNEKANLWGKDLYTYLGEIYGGNSKYCLMIVSGHYEKKHWTNLERQAAQAKAFITRHEYILPLRLDDTQIPGLLTTTGYIDFRYSNTDEVVDLIIQKLSDN